MVQRRVEQKVHLKGLTKVVQLASQRDEPLAVWLVGERAAQSDGGKVW